MEAEAELENGIRNARRVRAETKTADKLWEGSEERKEDPSSQEGRHIQKVLNFCGSFRAPFQAFHHQKKQQSKD